MVDFDNALYRIARNRRWCLSAVSILPLAWSRFATADSPASVDAGVVGRDVKVPAQFGMLDAFFAEPKAGPALRGSILLIHDRLGLTPRFPEIAKILASQGFNVLAPDYASRYGGSPSEEGPAREVLSMEKPDEMIAETSTALAWLKSQSGYNGRLAVVGYGWGGTAAGRILVKFPELAAGVIYYGHPPPAAEASTIKAHLLLNLASADPFVTPEVAAASDALTAAKVDFQLYVYPNTKPQFDNPKIASAFNSAAADLAWQRMMALLHATLDREV